MLSVVKISQIIFNCSFLLPPSTLTSHMVTPSTLINSICLYNYTITCCFVDHSTNLLGDRLGTRLLQLQVINALRRGDNQQASKFLLNLGEVKDYLKPNSFAYILEYCASKGDPLVILKFKFFFIICYRIQLHL